MRRDHDPSSFFTASSGHHNPISDHGLVMLRVKVVDPARITEANAYHAFSWRVVSLPDHGIVFRAAAFANLLTGFEAIPETRARSRSRFI